MKIEVLSKEEKQQIVDKLVKSIKNPEFEKKYNVRKFGIGYVVYYNGSKVFKVDEEPGETMHTIEDLEPNTIIEFFDNQCAEVYGLLANIAYKQKQQEGNIKKAKAEDERFNAQARRLQNIDNLISNIR